MENFELWSNHRECLDRNGNPKRRYFSEREAENTATHLEQLKNQKFCVYQCHDCGYYHLTKRPVAW